MSQGRMEPYQPGSHELPASAGGGRDGTAHGAPAGGRSQPLAEWDVDVSLWRNQVFLNQLALALGIPILLLFAVLLIAGRPEGLAELGRLIRIAALVAGILFVLALIAIGAVYGGTYEYHYTVDAEGIRGMPRGGTARKNRVVNLLLVLSGRPTAMGTGMLAASRQVEHVRWRDVRRVSADPQGKTIVLRGARRPLMVVFCDEAHYEELLSLAQQRTQAPT